MREGEREGRSQAEEVEFPAKAREENAEAAGIEDFLEGRVGRVSKLSETRLCLFFFLLSSKRRVSPFFGSATGKLKGTRRPSSTQQ